MSNERSILHSFDIHKFPTAKFQDQNHRLVSQAPIVPYRSLQPGHHNTLKQARRRFSYNTVTGVSESRNKYLSISIYVFVLLT
jgi:hypothetical protein